MRRINLGDNIDFITTSGNLLLQLVLGAGLIMLAIFGSMYVNSYIKGDTQKLRDEISRIDMEISNNNVIRTELEKFRTQEMELTNKNKIISELEAEQPILVAMLSELSDLVSPKISFITLDYDGKKVRIEGKAIDNVILADFMAKLRDSQFLGDVNLIRTVSSLEQNIDVMLFSVDVGIKIK